MPEPWEQLRRPNALEVVRSLRTAGTSTVAELARRARLSRPSVEEAVRDLVTAGYVEELDAAAGLRGRPARRFRITSSLGHVLGVDIGAHKAMAIATDLDGQVLARTRVPIDPRAGRQERLAHLDHAVATCLAAASLRTTDLWTVGVGSTGIITANGSVSLSVAVPEWTDVDLAGHLRDQLGCGVVVENDCRLAALAESWLGIARGVRDVIYVLAGLRTGAGLIVNGKLHRGFGGAAGEIGAHPFAGWESAQACLHRYTGLPSGIGADEAPAFLFAKAKEGDADARTVVERYARHLAFGAAALVLTLDPELVALGGGFSRSSDVLLGPFRHELEALVIRPPRVESSILGDESVALGAVRLALDQVDQRAFGLG